ncbi:MAG: hypothetical protein Ta2B_17360 [Termitinemataceae bacterium]|nr:MAG: hypothetical protein Ta2B_17360 [Termitinemataceae bacterium]
MKQNTLLKYSVLNTVGLFVYTFCQWLATLLVVRVSGFEDAGIYSLANSFVVVFCAVTSLSPRVYQISDVSHRHTDGTYIAARIITCIFSLLLFIIALSFVEFSPYVVVCCFALICYKLLEITADVFGGVLQKFNRYVCIALSYILKGIVPIISFSVVLYLKNLSFAIFAQMLTFLIIFLLYDVQVVVHHKDFTHNILLRDVPNIFLASIPLMISGFVYPSMMFITRYVINEIYSTEELGYYSSITMFILVMGFITGPMFSVFLPRISERYLHQEYTILKDIIVKVIRYIFLLGVALLAAVFLFGNFGLVLLFGNEIIPYSFLLPPIIIFSCISTIVSFFNSLLTAFQNRNQMMIANLIGIIPCTLLVQPLIVNFGMIGSFYCLMISVGIQAVLLGCITAIFLRRPYGSKEHK